MFKIDQFWSCSRDYRFVGRYRETAINGYSRWDEKAGLRAGCGVRSQELMLSAQENRWWSVKLQLLGSKEDFLRYAGRYARRPPIAQRRIIRIGEQEVEFLAKDRRLRRQVAICLPPQEFLAAWMQHIPERYEHAVRTFGLFAPRAIGDNSAAVFAILGQPPRQRRDPYVGVRLSSATSVGTLFLIAEAIA